MIYVRNKQIISRKKDKNENEIESKKKKFIGLNNTASNPRIKDPNISWKDRKTEVLASKFRSRRVLYNDWNCRFWQERLTYTDGTVLDIKDKNILKKRYKRRHPVYHQHLKVRWMEKNG